MDHIAIMKKSWRLLEKIVDGRKKIESRWYKTKRVPWDKIKKNDPVYFKNSGEPVRIKAQVEKVVQISNLTPTKVRKILSKYGELDGIEKAMMQRFFDIFKDKKYCILIFLNNARKIKPFEIDKTGFGAMSAWISVGDINAVIVRDSI